MTILNLCSSCGSKLTTLDIYCPNCGFLNKKSVIQSQVTPTKSVFSSLIGFGWGLLFIIFYFVTFYLTSNLTLSGLHDLFYILFFITWLILLVFLYEVTKKLTSNFPHFASSQYVKHNALTIFLGSAFLFLLFLIPSFLQNLALAGFLINILDLSFISVFAYLAMLFLIEYPDNLSVIGRKLHPKNNDIIKIPFITGIITGILFTLTIISQTALNSTQIGSVSINQISTLILTMFGYISPPIIIYFLYRNKKMELYHVKKSIFISITLVVIIVIETIIYVSTILISTILYPNTFYSSWILNFTLSLPTSIFTLIGTMAGLFILNYNNTKKANKIFEKKF